MRGKIKNLFIDATSSPYDIIIITETWLNESYNNEEILNSDWTIYRNDRDYNASGLSRGGGVMIAVRSTTSHCNVSTVQSRHFEYKFINILNNNTNLYIGAVYIPPNSDESIYNEFFNSSQKIIDSMSENDKIFIFGDFNRPKLHFLKDDLDNHLLPVNFTDEIDFSLIDLFYSNDIQQINGFPNSNGRWLDLVFTNTYDEATVSTADSTFNLFPNSKHHTAIIVELPTSQVSYNKSYNKKVVFDFKNANYEDINKALAAINWTDMLSSNDIDHNSSVFYREIFNIIELNVPKIVKKDKLTEPWLSKDLRALRNRRNKLYLQIKNNPNPGAELIQSHQKLASEFSSRSREAYGCYINNLSQNLITDPKKFFDFVNIKRKCNGYPSTMFKDNISSSEPSNICDMFAARFREVYRLPSKSNKNIPQSTSSIINCLSLTGEEILKELLNLDMNKGPGPDLIPPSFLHNCAQQLSVPLTLIFNNSLSLGTFPSDWKSSFLTPIYKSGDKCNIDNYRGIAILSAIPKLFEKLVYDKISSIINPLLNEQQHGFRKGRSTTTNLMLFTSDVLCDMEKGHQIDAVYTDFSKAFDSVDHNLLKFKLNSFGITGPILNWLVSYLNNRTQFVRFQGLISSAINVTSGVPQGSHLGPLLFNIFIKDLSECLKNIPHLFYADDLKLYKIITDMSDTNFFQTKLQHLEDWCNDNKLELNVNKCHVISFSRKKSTLLHNYHINGTPLHRVNHIRDLGILLDVKLSFTCHFDQIISKAKKMQGFIKRRAKEFNNVWVTKSLFCALVRPILEYACPIWNPFFQIHIDRIESIQKQFLLFALRDLYNPTEFSNLPSYADRLKILNIIPLSSRRTLLTSCFTLDVLKGNIDVTSIVNRIKFNDDVRRTRHTSLLKTYPHTKEYARNEPINRCCIIFNTHSKLYSPNISKNLFKSNFIRSLTIA